MDAAGAVALDEQVADLLVDTDVGSTEPVDRLLRVPDDEEGPSSDGDASPIGLPGSGLQAPGRVWLRRADAARSLDRLEAGAGARRALLSCEQHQNLRLQRVRVLELVNEDVPESILEGASDGSTVAHEIARFEQQVQEIERAGSRLQVAVQIHTREELTLQEACEIGICRSLKRRE